MIPENRLPTHPGEILFEEFLRPLEMSQTALAAHLGTSLQRINELINGKRGVTPETAWALAGAFGTTPEFWINLQTNHDLAKARPAKPIARWKAASR
jgi:antitoxin HigA-1